MNDHAAPRTWPAERLRRQIASEGAVGTFIKLPATEVIDIIALAGLDFAVVDLEHSQLTEGDALRLVRHARATATTPALVRLPDCDSGFINRCLEAGAAGIQLSSVRTVQQVRSLVAHTRYPPAGRRSVSLAHPSAGYGSVSLRDAVNAPHPLLVAQIEHGDTDDLTDILRQGMDVAFLGVTDLTVDVGFDTDRLEHRVKEVRDAANQAGVQLGIFSGSLEDAPPWAAYVTVSSDLALLRAAAEGITHG